MEISSEEVHSDRGSARLPPARMALWASMQGDIADEASDGAQTVFEGAGHYLQIERRDEVAATIRAVLP